MRKQYYRDAQKTDFFEQLLKSSQSAKNYGIELVPVLPNRSNPYPDYFYDFPKFPKTDQRSRFYNRQEMPVILFKLNKWRGDDKAGFFKQNSSLEIDVAKGDSLVFYMGEIFSKLSNINTTVANDSSKLVIDKMFKFSTKKEHELLRTFYVVDSIGKDSHILVSSSGIKFQGLKLRVVE